MNRVATMAEVTEEELPYLYENFKTTWLLAAVDTLDDIEK